MMYNQINYILLEAEQIEAICRFQVISISSKHMNHIPPLGQTGKPNPNVNHPRSILHSAPYRFKIPVKGAVVLHGRFTVKRDKKL